MALDYAFVAALTTAFSVVRYVLRRTFDGVLHSMGWKKYVARRKITENIWYGICYTLLSAWSLTILYAEPWTRQFSLGALWESFPQNKNMSNNTEMFLIVQLSFYLHSFVALLFRERRRLDFWAFALHHVVAVVLIGAAYEIGYVRVALAIFALHDISDVFLYTTKVVNLAKGSIQVVRLLFIVFALTFFATRLVVFPMVIYSSIVEAPEVLGPKSPGYEPLNALLCTLLVLHAYWFRLIIRATTQLGSKVIKDIRSDDEDAE